MPPRTWPWLLSVALGACAGTQAGPSRPTGAPSASQPVDAVPAAPPADGPRALPAAATFGELVARAGALRPPDGDSDAGCLLGRDRQGFFLGADLMPAFTTLPDAPSLLASRLGDGSATIHVLSGWGSLGESQADVLTATFTSTAPTGADTRASLIAVSTDGVRLRHSHADAEPGPIRIQDVTEQLSTTVGIANRLVIVTADAQVPLSTVHQLLASLPVDASIALGVVLPAGTKVPAAAAPARDDSLCPDGLPEPPETALQGELPAADVLQAIEPLRAKATGCMEGAPGAARGGPVTLGLRVDHDGRVQAACMVADGIGAPVLNRCLTRTALALRFPTPRPAGFVDIHLPLSLSAMQTRPQRATCATRPSP